ncbi:hypothetical protein [Lysinibacillus xylanilyticus]|uniref:hypothetical protein n=1 Tax=Lysinibacillus xylanilyticus TaxID=582475 RepID=UPI003D0679B8
MNLLKSCYTLQQTNKADYVRIVLVGNKWRFITGTYKTQAVANNAIAEMKHLSILSYAESIPA